MSLKLIANSVGDVATVGGSVLVVTSFRPLPDSFFVCLCGLWISKFILLCELAELSSCEVAMLAGGTNGTLLSGYGGGGA